MQPILAGQDLATNAVTAFQAALTAAAALAAQYSLSVVGALILLVVGYIAAGLVERSVYAAGGGIRGLDETLRRFFSRTARYGVLVLVIVMVLSQFGVQTASIIAALGAAGLAIGLALQGTLQNVAAGIMLLVLRPFRVGEYIDAKGVAGTIVEIGLFATQLRTYNGLFVLAPNSELWNSPVTNFSRNATRMEDIAIGIGYGDDIELARKSMLDLANADQRVLADPAPKAYVAELGDNAVVVNLRYWTKSPDWFDTARDLTKAAKLAFDAKGISIPFPQRDVHHFAITSNKAVEAAVGGN